MKRDLLLQHQAILKRLVIEAERHIDAQYAHDLLEALVACDRELASQDRRKAK